MRPRNDKWNVRFLKELRGWRILLIDKVALRSWISHVVFTSEDSAKGAVDDMIQSLERWNRV